MREILFRGKSTKTNQWIYGGFHIWEKRQVCVLGNDRLKDDEISCVITVNSFADWNMPRTIQAVEVIADTVGQYTGSADVNGKKIFEGDIIREGCNGRIGEVIRDNSGTYRLNGFGKDYTIEDAEIEWVVIGNIYDNPELLEVQE